MCFSAEVSFASAAVLVPAGAWSMRTAYENDRNLMPLATLPLLFGLQQLFEGLVRVGGAASSPAMIERYSLAYMFFSWLAWPVWVPFSTFFLEPCRRRYLYLLFAILGGMVGAMQYFPYFAHEEWLVTRFLPHAISDQGTVLFDYIMQRELTYAVYLFVIIAPLLSSSNGRANLWPADLPCRRGHITFLPVRLHLGLLFRRRADVALHCLYGLWTWTLGDAPRGGNLLSNSVSATEG
jgi:hypothetical protein